MTKETNTQDHDNQHLFDLVHMYRDDIIDVHNACPQCTTEAMLSFAVSEYTVHGWNLDQIIRKVTSEFNQWKLAVDEVIEDEGSNHRLQTSIVH